MSDQNFFCHFTHLLFYNLSPKSHAGMCFLLYSRAAFLYRVVKQTCWWNCTCFSYTEILQGLNVQLHLFTFTEREFLLVWPTKEQSVTPDVKWVRHPGFKHLPYTKTRRHSWCQETPTLCSVKNGTNLQERKMKLRADPFNDKGAGTLQDVSEVYNPEFMDS